MKNLPIAILLFYALVGTAYSFKCYKCDSDKDEDYTTEKCEKDQQKVDCESGNYTCFKLHGTTTNDKEKESRGCADKQSCESLVKMCKEGTDEQKKALNIQNCEAACCVSDANTPCNGGFTVSINMIIIMFAVLCSLKLF